MENENPIARPPQLSDGIIAYLGSETNGFEFSELVEDLLLIAHGGRCVGTIYLRNFHIRVVLRGDHAQKSGWFEERPEVYYDIRNPNFLKKLVKLLKDYKRAINAKS